MPRNLLVLALCLTLPLNGCVTFGTSATADSTDPDVSDSDDDGPGLLGLLGLGAIVAAFALGGDSHDDDCCCKKCCKRDSGITISFD